MLGFRFKPAEAKGLLPKPWIPLNKYQSSFALQSARAELNQAVAATLSAVKFSSLIKLPSLCLIRWSKWHVVFLVGAGSSPAPAFPAPGQCPGQPSVGQQRWWATEAALPPNLISLLPSTRAALIPDSRCHAGIVPEVTLQALWQGLFKGD